MSIAASSSNATIAVTRELSNAATRTRPAPIGASILTGAPAGSTHARVLPPSGHRAHIWVAHLNAPTRNMFSIVAGRATDIRSEIRVRQSVAMAHNDDTLTPYQQSLMAWIERMQDATDAMTPKQRDVLRDWEKANLDGHSVGTMDWPGWEPLIGPRPRPHAM